MTLGTDNSSHNAPSSATSRSPRGADTDRSSNAAFQPRKYTSYERDRNGSDEATFRRYNARHARFDQPDPSDGSYDLADPQSLNRYAYVQNDPVNFVDPLGLNLAMITCYEVPFGGLGTGEGGSHREFFFLGNARRYVCVYEGGGDTGRRSPGDLDAGGGGGGQWDHGKLGTRKDCFEFADIVGEIASRFKDDPRGFVNALWDRFAKSGYEFGSANFKEPFRDPEFGSSNQARHYVGGLWAGFEWGLLGGMGANMRENPGVDWSDAKPWQNNPVPKPRERSPSQKADVALNAVSTRHGLDLFLKRTNPTGLKNKILEEVCDKRK